METRILRLLVSLGVPGVALGIFYLLFRSFKWEFAQVPAVWVGPIVVLFMVLTTSVVFYALTRWAPSKPDGATNMNRLSGLSKNLDDVDVIVKELDSTFIDLARRFADRDILRKPQLLRVLLNAADKYLYDRVLLPRLMRLKGVIESASKNPNLKSRHAELPSLLDDLAHRIQDYRAALGEGSGATGVARDDLMHLCGMAKQIKRDQGVDEVVAFAEGIRDHQSHRLSEEIQLNIGLIQDKIRS